MSNFSETLHPRGQAANAGQFKAKCNAAPAAELIDGDFDLEEVRKGLAASHAAALDAESAAWFILALEKYGDGAAEASFEFQTDDGGTTEVFSGNTFLEEDSLREAIPERFTNGIVRIEYRDASYTAWVRDDEADETLSVSLPADARLTADAARVHAMQMTEHRAAARDAEEQAAIVEAFERYSELADTDKVAFTPDRLNGAPILRIEYTQLSIAAADGVQATAFRFLGENVSRVEVSRTGDGIYDIQRTITSPLSRSTGVHTTDFDGTPKRWVGGGI